MEQINLIHKPKRKPNGITKADREDEISEKRRTMIAELDARMVRETKSEDIFIVEWEIK